MLEIAATFFAGISAVSSAVQVWRTTRNKEQAAEAFDTTFEEVLNTDKTIAAAEQLVKIIPTKVIKQLESRAKNCWSNYREVLDGEYLPQEIDKATSSVQSCVCRELGRIYVLNGSIPPNWHAQWKQYNCEDRIKGF